MQSHPLRYSHENEGVNLIVMYGKKETENRRWVMWVFCFCFSPFRLKLKVKFPRVTQHASLLILLLHVLGMLLEAPQRSAGCWLSGKGVQQYWTRNKETMWERCTNMNVCPGRIGAPEARLLLCTSNCPFKLSLIHTVPEQCKTACVL